MNVYKLVIPILRKLIPDSKFRQFLARKFEKKYREYLKNLENPTEFSFCSSSHLEFMLSLIEKCISKGLEGDIIECGVYKGGSCLRIAKKMKSLQSKKILYALDTFEGHPYDDLDNMPANLRKEVYNKKTPKVMKKLYDDVNLEEIKNKFMEENLDNTIFLKGLFEESFKEISDRKFCFAHVDADTYLSVKQCIEFLKPRMVSDGIMLFDDYNMPEYPGCNKAVDDLLGRSSLILLKPHKAYWIKP